MKTYRPLFLTAAVLAATGMELGAQLNWVNISPPMDANHEIYSACMSEEGEGLVATMRNGPWGIPEEPVLWFTADGGENWEAREATGYPAAILSSATYRVNNQRWYSGGWDGYLMRSDDGGYTWIPATLAFVLENAIDIHFLDDSTGIVATQEASHFTFDGGDSWDYQYMPDSENRSFFFLNDSIGYLIGRRIWRTTNGGLGWSLAGTAPAILFTAHVFSDNSLLGLPDQYNASDPKLYESLDAGNTWSARLLDINEVEGIDDLHFFNDFQGIVTARGLDSVVMIFQTNDRGFTWFETFRDTLPHLGKLRLRPIGDGRLIFYAEYGRFLMISEGTLTGISASPAKAVDRLSLAPSPLVSSSVLSINPPARDGRLQIFNISGDRVKVMEQVHGPRVELQAADLSPGLYFIQLVEEDNVSAALRFVRQ